MLRYVKLYKIFFIQYLKGLMQSKVDFLIGLMAFSLNQALGIIFLYLVFENIPNLNGWDFNQLVFIYAYAQIPRGIDHFFTDYLWLFARKTVKEGEFDRYLLRPINPLFQILVERCQPDGLGEILIGILLIAYSIGKIGTPITPVNILLFLISIFAGALIFGSIKLFFSSNTFYLKDAYSLLYMVYNTSDFVKYPLSIYSKGVRFVLSYIIPFGFTAFIPASYFLNKGSIFNTILMECVIAVIAFGVSYKYFCVGCNRYESAGN